MQAKHILTYSLLVFVAASLGYLAIDNRGETEVDSPPKSQTAEIDIENPMKADLPVASEKAERRLVAYYFHGNTRCPTCLAIEEFSKGVLENSFAGEVESGSIEWKAINTDDPENSGFIQEFDLSFSSLIIADVSGGETLNWKNLPDVWTLTDDAESFSQYVKTEIQSFLEPK